MNDTAQQRAGFDRLNPQASFEPRKRAHSTTSTVPRTKGKHQ
jgi:hypothetical protein